MRRNLILQVVILLITGVCSLHSQEYADRIAAVVDNEIILESELISQAQMYAMQRRIDQRHIPELKQQFLESMINKRLLLAKAIRDSVVVSDTEVQQELDQQLRQFEQTHGSLEQVAEQLGMTLPRLRREMREDIRKELLVQRLQSRKFAQMRVSRREVREFYEKHRHELPPVPEQVEVAHIFLIPEEDEDVRARAFSRAGMIMDSIIAGADFAAMARQYSADAATANNGGDLGLVRRGLFVREFEEAAFSLSPGEISGIVETQFGLHIIKLEERRGDSVRPRHILLRIERSQESDRPTIEKLNELRRRAQEGESFEDLAREYSDDADTAPFGGVLGTVPADNLEPDIRRVVAGLEEGEISEPSRLNIHDDYGYSVILLKRRIPESTIDFDRDFNFLEQFTLQSKMESEFEKLLEELRSEIYWESRM